MLTPQEAMEERARRRRRAGCTTYGGRVYGVYGGETLREQVARLQAQVGTVESGAGGGHPGAGQAPDATEQLGLWEG